jgi:UDP-N-acetylglucosamine--N-acetylmuramyl-(pentapeptide) pyrophosphoryl-undecaprenol N-acetylglucosamine transferase
MAGGTGGHVFPALAVADYLEKAGWRIVWLGTKGGMEESLVSQKGYGIKFIDFSGLRGKNLMVWFTLPVRLLIAFWQSAKLLFQLRPDVVLGMGGYPAFPGGIMASLLNKPLLIHEQNSIPGLTNKILVKFADKVLTGFPGSIKDKKKVVFSGNPVRNEISQLDTPDNRYEGRSGNLKLLIIGGSLGAQALNTIVPQALNGVEGELVVFIEDMAVQYSECDLVICRAGALTISELASAGIASILVPFPYAVDNHQTYNAKFLSSNGAAVLLPEDELTPGSLANLLSGLTREKLLEMAMKARELAKPNATRIVAEECMEMIKQ